MIKHIATQAVYVEDQDKALEFWIDKVGFEKRADHDMGNGYRWLEVAPKNAESCIVLYPKALMKDWEEKKPSIVFLCDDAEKTYEELKAKDVKILDEPKKMRWGVFTTFEDNDGNQFVIRSNPQ